MLERVVVTGMGIVSCLGNDARTVRDALFEGKSGIRLSQAHIDAGMRSHVAGAPQIDLAEHIDRKQWRFMGDAAGYTYLSLTTSDCAVWTVRATRSLIPARVS
jgi:3-oxoacyl-[acyl-carrier-protein] synthase-1